MNKRIARDRDIERFAKGIRAQAEELERRAGEEDPWVAAEIIALSAELRDAGMATIGRLRERGVRWADIGFEFGIGPVTMQKRYDRWRASRAAA